MATEIAAIIGDDHRLVEREVSAALALNVRLAEVKRSWSAAGAVAVLAEADVTLPTLERILVRLDAAARPATAEEVALNVAKMIASYPYAEKFAASYARSLCEDVLEAGCSLGAVEATMRNIRRTMKFAPTVAEVLDMLEANEARRDFVRRVATALPAQLVEVRALLAAPKEQFMTGAAERIDKMVADYRAWVLEAASEGLTERSERAPT